MTGYKKFFDQKELQIKMSSVMSFTFNAVNCTLWLLMKNLGHVPGKCVRHYGMRKQPDECSGTTVLKKIFSINISWRLHPQWVRLLIGPGIHKN